MNHVPIRDAPVRPLTRRALAKQETHGKILQAAKRLFISRGYEAATIRDIAAEAGMSTGAVFANFTDKHDLFQAVLQADFEVHSALVEDAVNYAGPIEDALTALFAVGYSLHLDQLPLLQAATGLSWTSGLAGELGDRPIVENVQRLVREMLTKAIDRKEIAADTDVALVAGMVWDIYLASYRLALFADWEADKLTARFNAQMRIILNGLR